MLGSSFRDVEGRDYKIITTHHQNPDKDTIPLDVTNHKDVQDKIGHLNPDVVIHSAALTNVDYCEEHPAEAWALNVQGTENIIKACKMTGSKLIYVSSDFVFDGCKGNYSEDDGTCPLNYYAYTKLKGEEAVWKSGLEYAITRVSVLYGWHARRGFVSWVTNELNGGHEINVVDDHYNSPTLDSNARDAILKIIETDKQGIYHTSGSQRISRFDFAVNISRVFELDESLINPIKSSDLVQKAKRPKDSSLSVNKVHKDLKINMINTLEGLKHMREARL
ncbi:NAD(P)-dependent oxidoreductase [Methanobacterium petrolearium]|nr:NAD(P)-dependent oxidoreductase [Methanobacterium petrolearium]